MRTPLAQYRAPNMRKGKRTKTYAEDTEQHSLITGAFKKKG
jgi:hypothetical protein